MKRGLIALAKNVNSGQPAQSDKTLCFLVSFFVCRRTSLLNVSVRYKPFLKQDLVFMCLQYKFFENPVGKGEIARN